MLFIGNDPYLSLSNTDAKKKELFSKMRSGDVRVMLGSTSKCGTGMCVQDRLIAMHDLDCPWRPGDLRQRSGRIERRGNMNSEAQIYRYVTEATFDAYLWQTVEKKQKFISQIMTSKSPVRECDDLDAAALSYAEIKALCAGDPLIKERMDLDVDVAKLKLLKASHQSVQYRLEDNLLKHFPEEIERNKGFITGFEQDMATLAEHTPKEPLQTAMGEVEPQGEQVQQTGETPLSDVAEPLASDFRMIVKGDVLTDKDNAGAAILAACAEVKKSDPVEIGSYKGFTMLLSYEAFGAKHKLMLKGAMTHVAELGLDARGNLLRIDNALSLMPKRLEGVTAQLENLYRQVENAKSELGKPFPKEAELKEKSARLAYLDAKLNLSGGRTEPTQDSRISKQERPSVLDSLKQPPQRGSETPKKPKPDREER